MTSVATGLFVKVICCVLNLFFMRRIDGKHRSPTSPVVLYFVNKEKGIKKRKTEKTCNLRRRSSFREVLKNNIKNCFLTQISETVSKKLYSFN